ncbi:MAG: calcium/sodium antiporter [Lachnospiraceae bacterium]|nr:calcium/sodium antiporter [Lachnospiraceae bacterium]
MIQNMFMAIGLLLIGFVLLMKGADFFVEGASSVAKQFKIPALVIGMTIVALGTSLPELSVSVAASLRGSNALAISNVLGSNLFNLMVVLGASALIIPLSVDEDVIKKDLPFSMLAALLLLVIGATTGKIGFVAGVIFLVLFLSFIFNMVLRAMKARHEGKETAMEQQEEKEAEDIKIHPIWLSIIFIVGGACAIKFGGDFVVDSAVYIAKFFGVSETLIGLTIVACGTSLPELATSLAAAKKNELDMAVGNAVGSNVFNILAILGVAAVLTPVAMTMENVIDAIVLLVFSAIIWLFAKKQGKLDRKAGGLMVLLYVIYLVYICMR